MTIMKKLILGLVLSGISVLPTFGQGALIFANLGGPGADSNSVSAAFFDVNGTTRLAGVNFSAQLYYGTLGTLEGSLVNTLSVGLTPVVNFNSGGLAGFFSSTPTVTLNGSGTSAPIGQTATIQFRVWDNRTGSTWETATVRGQSAVLTSPTLANPNNAFDLNYVSTLGSVTLVPEPATIAFGIFGAAGLLFRRRK